MQLQKSLSRPQRGFSSWKWLFKGAFTSHWLWLLPGKGKILGQPVPSAPGQFLRGYSARSHQQAIFLAVREGGFCPRESLGSACLIHHRSQGVVGGAKGTKIWKEDIPEMSCHTQSSEGRSCARGSRLVLRDLMGQPSNSG